MLRRLAVALGAPLLGAALRRDLQEPVSAEVLECPSDVFPDGKKNCVDAEGKHVPLQCCRSTICKPRVSRLSEEGALRMQTYMMGCGLLPSDIQPVDGVMTVVDSTRLCAEQCQKLPALMAVSPLTDLEGLESLCADELSFFQAIIQNLAAFDKAWAACAEEAEIDIDELKETTMPVAQAADWSISGTVESIQAELRQQADFPVSCPSKFVGEPVWLVMQSATAIARQQCQKAWAASEGLASIEGMGMFATKAAYMYEAGGKGLKLAHALAAAPSKASLDQVVDSLLDSSAGPLPSPLRKFWRWLLKTQNMAILTVEDPAREGFSQVAKFRCTEGSVEGSPAKAFATWVDGDVRTPVTARHLAFLITSLA